MILFFLSPQIIFSVFHLFCFHLHPFVSRTFYFSFEPYTPTPCPRCVNVCSKSLSLYFLNLATSNLFTHLMCSCKSSIFSLVKNGYIYFLWRFQAAKLKPHLFLFTHHPLLFHSISPHSHPHRSSSSLSFHHHCIFCLVTVVITLATKKNMAAAATMQCYPLLVVWFDWLLMCLSFRRDFGLCMTLGRRYVERSLETWRKMISQTKTLKSQCIG